MAEVQQEAKVSYAGWERECMQAARDRQGRRLGDGALGQRLRLGAAARSEGSGQMRADIDERVIQPSRRSRSRR